MLRVRPRLPQALGQEEPPPRKLERGMRLIDIAAVAAAAYSTAQILSSIAELREDLVGCDVVPQEEKKKTPQS